MSTFTDNGEGMDPERARQLRQLMAKKEMQTSAEDERVLSLMMANEFIRLHGGALHISSQKGKGTTVTLNIPASRLLSTLKKSKKSEQQEPA